MARVYRKFESPICDAFQLEHISSKVDAESRLTDGGCNLGTAYLFLKDADSVGVEVRLIWRAEPQIGLKATFVRDGTMTFGSAKQPRSRPTGAR